MHSVVSFPSLGPLLQWVLVNYTVFGKSVDYLSQSALKIVGARKTGSNESVVSLKYNLVLLQQTTYYILYCSFLFSEQYYFTHK